MRHLPCIDRLKTLYTDVGDAKDIMVLLENPGKPADMGVEKR